MYSIHTVQLNIKMMHLYSKQTYSIHINIYVPLSASIHELKYQTR